MGKKSNNNGELLANTTGLACIQFQWLNANVKEPICRLNKRDHDQVEYPVLVFGCTGAITVSIANEATYFSHLYWRLGLNHNSTTEFSNGIMTMYNIGHFLVLFNAFSFYGQPILLIWTNTFFYFFRYLYKFCNVIHVHFLITSIPEGDVAVIATANLCVLNCWSRIRKVAKLQGKVTKKG